MKEIPKASSWNLPPTPKQVRAISKLCLRFGISEALEEKPRTRLEARQLIFRLRQQAKDNPQWKEKPNEQA